jgi:NAD(P)-dependent dehydrogenase (short-subunit alcohol dehydrogenase family)
MNKMKKVAQLLFAKTSVKVPVLISVQSENLLNDRCAIITGGTSGIGYAIAESFLNAGATVIITGRNEEKLNAAVESLKTKFENRIFGYMMDNNCTELFHSAILKMREMVGMDLDILVNNAGINATTCFPDISEEDYDRVVSANLKAVVFLSQEFSKYMIEREIHGNILNIGSSSGLRPAVSPYMVSKWGVRGLTLGMAKSLIKYDIVVNGIAPGPTSTPMLVKNMNNLSGTQNDAKRYLHPQEVASMATQLVSNSCRMMVGEMVNIGGGSGTLTFDDITY